MSRTVANQQRVQLELVEDRPRKPSSVERVKSRRPSRPHLLIVPLVALLVSFYLVPAAYTLAGSFQEISFFDFAGLGEWVGLSNYRTILSEGLGRVLTNTAVWLTATTVAIRICAGLGLALLLESAVLRRYHLTGVARLLVLVPWMVPPVVAVATWRWLLDPSFGVLTSLLRGVGAVEAGEAVLADPSTAWAVIIAIVVWRELPLTTLMVLAGLQSVSNDLYEAASVDGASALNRFRYVTLPHVMPVIAVVALVTSMWTFNNFSYVWLTTRGGPGGTTAVLGTYLYTKAFIEFDIGAASAIAVFGMSLLILVFAAYYPIWRRSSRVRAQGDTPLL
jgi:multiple sugar transport system permease protein